MCNNGEIDPMRKLGHDHLLLEAITYHIETTQRTDLRFQSYHSQLSNSFFLERQLAGDLESGNEGRKLEFFVGSGRKTILDLSQTIQYADFHVD